MISDLDKSMNIDMHLMPNLNQKLKLNLMRALPKIRDLHKSQLMEPPQSNLNLMDQPQSKLRNI